MIHLNQGNNQKIPTDWTVIDQLDKTNREIDSFSKVRWHRVENNTGRSLRFLDSFNATTPKQLETLWITSWSDRWHVGVSPAPVLSFTLLSDTPSDGTSLTIRISKINSKSFEKF